MKYPQQCEIYTIFLLHEVGYSLYLVVLLKMHL